MVIKDSIAQSASKNVQSECSNWERKKPPKRQEELFVKKNQMFPGRFTSTRPCVCPRIKNVVCMTTHTPLIVLKITNPWEDLCAPTTVRLNSLIQFCIASRRESITTIISFTSSIETPKTKLRKSNIKQKLNELKLCSNVWMEFQ